jgi:NitT/TauT family transport system substrate-binding protein
MEMTSVYQSTAANTMDPNERDALGHAMKRFRPLCVAVFLLTLSIGIASPSFSADAPLPLNLGVMGGDSTAEGFYAQDMGFFKAEGLDVKMTVMLNGAALTSAMSSGSLDIGVASVGVVAMAHERDLPVHFVAPATIYTQNARSTLLMVPKDSTASSGADLNGQIIAINGLKDLTQFTTAAWIDKNGGDVRTVKFIELPFSEMATALQQHRVAAALMTEPFASAAKPVARVLGNAGAAVGNKYLVMGWFAQDSWTAQNSETIRRFRLAITRAAVWANAHPSESAAILARYTKMTVEMIRTMARAKYDTTGALDPTLMQPVIDTAARYGTLSHAFPASELIAPAPTPTR